MLEKEGKAAGRRSFRPPRSFFWRCLAAAAGGLQFRVQLRETTTDPRADRRHDGDDADGLSDGCIRIATLNDLNAEWTGGVFDDSGRHFFVSVQHNVTGHGVVLDITGWR